MNRNMGDFSRTSTDIWRSVRDLRERNPPVLIGLSWFAAVSEEDLTLGLFNSTWVLCDGTDGGALSLSSVRSQSPPTLSALLLTGVG